MKRLIAIAVGVAIGSGVVVWMCSAPSKHVKAYDDSGHATLFCSSPMTPIATDNEHYFCAPHITMPMTQLVSPRECALENGAWFTKNMDSNGMAVWVPGQDCALYGPYPPKDSK